MRESFALSDKRRVKLPFTQGTTNTKNHNNNEAYASTTIQSSLETNLHR